MGMTPLGHESCPGFGWDRVDDKIKPRKLLSKHFLVLNGLLGILALSKANQATGLMLFSCMSDLLLLQQNWSICLIIPAPWE